MENYRTLSIGTSVNELKKAVYAECAWNDITTIASIPPTYNATAADEAQVQRLLRESYTASVAMLAGYVKSSDEMGENSEIWLTELAIPSGIGTHLDHAIQTMLERLIIEQTLERLYSTQFQTRELWTYYLGKHEYTRQHLIETLACGQ